MTDYDTNADDIQTSIKEKKKEEFINYIKDFDSNFKKKNNTNSLYEESIKVNFILFV